MDIEARLRDLHAKKTSRYRAAELLGVNRYSLDAMIETLGLDWPPGLSRLYTLDGIEATMKEHAARLGVKVNTLRWRLNNRRKSPPQPTEEDAKKFATLRAEGVPAWEAALKTGYTYDQLRPLAKKLCPGYGQAVARAQRVRRTKRELEAV